MTKHTDKQVYEGLQAGGCTRPVGLLPCMWAQPADEWDAVLVISVQYNAKWALQDMTKASKSHGLQLVKKKNTDFLGGLL